MKSTTRIVIGLLIAAVGISFLLNNLQVLPFGIRLSDWWPLLIVAGGILILLSDVKNYIWSLLVIVFGVLFQLKELDIIEVYPWQLFWPILIIAVGLSVVINHTAKKPASKDDHEDVTVVLSGSESRVQAKDYKGSKVTAIMGGVVLDLTEATIKKEATVDLFCLWGGIEIRVPDGVIVKDSTSAILGGVENTAASSEVKESSPVLRVIGDVVMAGVEIKRGSAK